MRADLIKVETIKEYGFIEKNVETNLITTTLRRVQDTMLEPIIGTSLMRRLQTGVDDNDLNAVEELLLNDYIVPFLIAACDLRIIDHLTYKIRAKSVGKVQDANFQPVSETENNRLADQLRSDVGTYKNKLIGFLCENEDNYPEYKDYVCNKEFKAPQKGQKQQVTVRFR